MTISIWSFPRMKGEKNMGKDLKGKELGKGLTQRKNGKYSAKFKSKKAGKRIEEYFDTLKEAKAWLTKARAEDLLGMANYCNLTVDEWFQRWYQTYKLEQERTYSTRTGIKQRYETHVKPVLGRMKLANVKNYDCQKVFNILYQNTYSEGTQLQIKSEMSDLFHRAIIARHIPYNPVDGVLISSKKKTEEPVAMTQKQEEIFLKYVQKDMYHLLFEFILETGLRINEALGLQWKYVKSDRIIVEYALHREKEAHVYLGDLKTISSHRSIPLNAKAKRILSEQRKHQLEMRMKSKRWKPKEDFKDLVFTTTTAYAISHNNLNYSNLPRIVKRINKDNPDINFPELSCHDLRHTFATRCIESGMSPDTVKRLMGHASIKTTMDNYVWQSSENIKHEMERKIVVKVS